MNILIIAVILIVIFLLVFVMFSLDDHEDEEGFLTAEANEAKTDSQSLSEPQSSENKTVDTAPEITGPMLSKHISEHNKAEELIKEQSESISADIAPVVAVQQTEIAPEPEVETAVHEVQSSLPEEAENSQQSTDNNTAETVQAISQENNQNNNEQKSTKFYMPPMMTLPTAGSEDDFKFRVNIDERVAIATAAEKQRSIAAVVQIRFPRELSKDPDKFLRMLQRAEAVVESDYAFAFSGGYLNQLNRIWIFQPNKEDPLSDPVFEALVVAFEVVSKFKLALKEDSILAESKAKITVGLALGDVLKIEHGAINPPVWAGETVAMAEALADSAIDMNINVDENIHTEALPLFNFREWKPIMLRATMPEVPMFELVGWNNPDDITAYAKDENPRARRSVAIAFRYLEFLDDKLPTLITLASDSDNDVRYEALVTIKSIANEKMLSVLKNNFPTVKDPDMRAVIIDTFSDIGNREVIPLVIGSTKESHWLVRCSAAKALYILNKAESLKTLEPLLKDSNGCVRCTVNYIFYKETGEAVYLQNIVELSTGLSKRARVSAIDALFEIDKEAGLREILNSFSEQDYELQKHILRRMETEHSEILYQSFLALFKNSGEKIRPDIIEAVRRAGIVN